MAGYAHGTTREDIFAAANQIFAQGKNPTQAAVRAALGKGSFSTISKYLAEWREQQTDIEAIPTSTDDMPDQIRQLLNRTYAAIRTHAEATVAGEQVITLEAENERLREKLADHDTTKAELAGLRYGYQEAIARLEQLTRENERVNRYLPEIDRVEELALKCQRQDKELEELHEKNGQLELTKAHLEDQASTLQRNLQTAIDRANGMEQQLHQAEAAVVKLNQQVTQLADRNQELLSATQAYDSALGEKLAEIEELKNELKVAKAKLTTKPRSRKLKDDIE